jgi:hypothetical protein
MRNACKWRRNTFTGPGGVLRAARDNGGGNVSLLGTASMHVAPEASPEMTRGIAITVKAC